MASTAPRLDVELLFGYYVVVSTTDLAWQPSLLGGSGERAASWATLERRDLAGGAWVDRVPGFVGDTNRLFDLVAESAPWGGVETRPMYDRVVEVPRLHTGLWREPPERVLAIADALSAHYGIDLRTISANLYRDGSDSVAWHGDRVGRHRADTVVAILTLGSARRFLLRPNGGGRSLAFDPGPGDLLVMGGTCQRTWEHSVPKRARAGPRICLMFREPHGN